MLLFDEGGMKFHQYYVFASGTNLKPKYFNSRREATAYVYAYCTKHNIDIECTEQDKHEYKYSDHNGIRFYINRV